MRKTLALAAAAALIGGVAVADSASAYPYRYYRGYHGGYYRPSVSLSVGFGYPGYGYGYAAPAYGYGYGYPAYGYGYSYGYARPYYSGYYASYPRYRYGYRCGTRVYPHHGRYVTVRQRGC